VCRPPGTPLGLLSRRVQGDKTGEGGIVHKVSLSLESHNGQCTEEVADGVAQSLRVQNCIADPTVSHLVRKFLRKAFSEENLSVYNADIYNAFQFLILL